MKHWYTLQTKPKSEYRVAAILQQRQIETYLPEIGAAKVQQAEKKAPLFPCYLFMRLDLNVTAFSQWQWTPGLRRIVSFGHVPVPLPDQVIDLIRQRVQQINATSDKPAHSFKPGDPVRIIDGPLKDMEAIFAGPTTPGERVQVLLTILGRLSRVQVQAAHLKKKAPTPPSTARRPRRTRGRGRPIKQQDLT